MSGPTNGLYRPGDEEVPMRVMLRQLSEKIDSSISKQEEHNKTVARLTNIVLGDPEAEVPGLVHKVQKHGKYISADKKMKIAATVLVGGGAGAGFWDKIAAAMKTIFG